MAFNFLSILPLAALTLGGCTLNAKLLGEPNYDSSTDSDSDGSNEDTADATSSSSSAGSDGSSSSTTSAGSEGTSSTSTTGPEATSSSSSAGSEGTSSTSTTGPEATSSSSSAGSDTDQTSTSTTSTSGPEETSSSSSWGSDTQQTGTSSSSGVETGGGQLCEDPPLDAPGIDRSCQFDQDCLVVFHQSDCCGSVDAYSVNTQSIEAWQSAAAPCTFEPFCDCAPEATDAEDGESTADKDEIVAVCIDNVCRSAVP
ncbi:hypothetical protein OV203_27765 [Nannocystis sp. ILAH1]|uniref:hypothetical protein n=1 Tax=unclassified Nannocystis TaxID=2627009 RepID=UPI00226E38F0|nr:MULTISPECIES: hypothetical protein [unclassified Nannocystis]MCY0990973.1 hypothetical protein [Nannocystis sp. ILAH1]MCY1064478.1 hypothetical protein [Nannocystis sp. RBIL2]